MMKTRNLVLLISFITMTFAIAEASALECTTFPYLQTCNHGISPEVFVDPSIKEEVRNIKFDPTIPYRSPMIAQKLLNGFKFNDFFIIVDPRTTWIKLQKDMASFFKNKFYKAPRIIKTMGTDFAIAAPELIKQASLLMTHVYDNSGLPAPRAKNIHFMGGNLTWCLGVVVKGMADDFLRDNTRQTQVIIFHSSLIYETDPHNRTYYLHELLLKSKTKAELVSLLKDFNNAIFSQDVLSSTGRMRGSGFGQNNILTHEPQNSNDYYEFKAVLNEKTIFIRYLDLFRNTKPIDPISMGQMP